VKAASVVTTYRLTRWMLFLLKNSLLDAQLFYDWLRVSLVTADIIGLLEIRGRL